MRLLFSIFFSLCSLVAMAKPLKVMVITGQTGNGHSWQVMSKSLEGIYGSSKAFDAEIVVMPRGGVGFDPQFSGYDAIVMNINHAKWTDAVKKRFEDYVSNGGGVVIVHEANNAFPEWKEYNKMIGIGGWNGRNEKDGPYVYWKDGKIVRDNSAGVGGRHGRRVPFEINVRNSKHPIMKGLPSKWTHNDDELYGLLRGPAENLEVLATGFSDKKTGGSNREEPILMTITYGKGRIFHTILGHTQNAFTKAVDNKGYQVTLLRGTEWAATGKVKMTSKLKF